MGIRLRPLRLAGYLQPMLGRVGRRHAERFDRRPFFDRSHRGPWAEAVLFCHAVERDIHLDLAAAMDMNPCGLPVLAFGKEIVPLQRFVAALNENFELPFNLALTMLCRQHEQFLHALLAVNLDELDVRDMLPLQKYLNDFHYCSSSSNESEQGGRPFRLHIAPYLRSRCETEKPEIKRSGFIWGGTSTGQSRANEVLRTAGAHPVIWCSREFPGANSGNRVVVFLKPARNDLRGHFHGNGLVRR